VGERQTRASGRTSGVSAGKTAPADGLSSNRTGRTAVVGAAAPVYELPGLIAELAALQARAAMRLRSDPPPAAEDEPLLTIDEAAARLAVSKDWLRRRPELPFVVKLSDGAVRCSSRRLAAYVARQSAR
jgi:hypothetical protein